MRQLRESGAYLRPAAGARATIRMIFMGRSLPTANLASIADVHRTVNKVCLGHRAIHRTLRSNAIGASTKSLFSHELFRTIGVTCADRALSQNAVAKMAPRSKRAFGATKRLTWQTPSSQPESGGIRNTWPGESLPGLDSKALLASKIR